MNKLFFSVVVALFFGLTVTSCSKDELIESSNTVWMEVTIHSDEWDLDTVTQDLTVSLKWPIIDQDVLACGNVMAYYYEGGRQVPLPYVRRWEYINPFTGLVDQVPINIRFDIEPNVITFVVSDLSQYRIDRSDLGEILGPMTFRAVCTYPVLYKI